MAHIVTCVYCKERFDRDKIPFVQVSQRRYAHVACHEKNEASKTQEQRDEEALNAYIIKLFNEPYVNARIKKQIKEYREAYNYTYSGILKTLVWWYEIKGNSIEKANGGIGIVPYVYQDACTYYYSLYLAHLANEEKPIETYQTKVKEVEIFSPRVWIAPPRLFDLGEDEEDGE